MENKNIWNKYGDQEEKELVQLGEDYKTFLNRGKTERECVTEAVAMAEAKGYRDLSGIIERGETLSAGDKVYAVNMKKSIALFIIGERPDWISNRIRCMRIRISLIWIRIIMAASKNTSGWPVLWLSMAWLSKRTAR